MTESKIYNTPIFNVMIFSLMWAVQIFVSKLAFNAGATPVVYVFQSILVALAIFVVALLPLIYKEIKSLSFEIKAKIFTLNMLFFGGGSMLSIIGINFTTATHAGFVVKLAMVWIIFFSFLILKEKITSAKAIAAIVMLIGAFFLMTRGEFAAPYKGDFLILIATVVWGFTNVMFRKILKNTAVSASLITFLRPVAGIPVLLVLVLLAPFYTESVRSIFAVNLLEFTYGGYALIGGVVVGLSWVFVNRTLKVASASYMTMMSMISPVILTVLAYVFLGERLIGIQIVGALLIIFSGILVHKLKLAHD